ILGMADQSGVWINQTDNNTTDPDAGGAGWIPMYSYGIASATSVGGTLTLTSAQSRKGIIIIGGALVSNLQVVFPNTVQRWIIINTTTGSFTMTAKTAAGTGVTIPQGGYSGP